MKIYKLSNIKMAGNEHGKLKADVIYAELLDHVSNLRTNTWSY